MNKLDKWVRENPMPPVTTGLFGYQNPYWVDWKVRYQLALRGEAYING